MESVLAEDMSFSIEILVNSTLAMEVGIFSTSFLPGMILFTPFIVFVFVFIDYCLVFTTSMYGINALIRARKKGVVSTKYMLVHMVLHLLFFFEVISAIFVLKKYSDEEEGTLQNKRFFRIFFL